MNVYNSTFCSVSADYRIPMELYIMMHIAELQKTFSFELYLQERKHCTFRH